MITFHLLLAPLALAGLACAAPFACAQDALYEPLPYRVSDHDPVIVGLVLTD